MLNRSESISIQFSAFGHPPFAALYAYNAANQRTTMTHHDGSRWEFGYDGLGQVSSGQKKLPANGVISGYDYAYTFDDIGNRRTTTLNGRAANYTPNLLNQYDQREVPRTLDVLGTATAAATISVNGAPATRQGERVV